MRAKQELHGDGTRILPVWPDQGPIPDLGGHWPPQFPTAHLAEQPRFLQVQQAAEEELWGQSGEPMGCSRGPQPPAAVQHSTAAAGTHIGDDFELADVGGLSVQQLPDGFLLVALPARQGLPG